MKQLWAPWRIEYITKGAKEEGCFLCKALNSKDEDALVVARGKKVFVVMNKYPYNPGHLMVVPNEHVADIYVLDDETALELMKFTSKSIEVLKRLMNPDGFNVGINLGKCAGAGLEDHVHIHVVPRWCGDTNFMPVLADVKVIPEHLRETFRKIREEFGRL